MNEFEQQQPTSVEIENSHLSQYKGISKILSILKIEKNSLEMQNKFIHKINSIKSEVREEVFYCGNMSDLWNYLGKKICAPESPFSYLDKKLLSYCLQIGETLFLERAIFNCQTIHSWQELEGIAMQKKTQLRERIFQNQQNIDTKIDIKESSLIQEYLSTKNNKKLSKWKILAILEDMILSVNLEKEDFLEEFLQFTLQYIRRKVDSELAVMKYFSQVCLMCQYLELSIYGKSWKQLAFSEIMIHKLYLKRIVEEKGSYILIKFMKEAPIKELRKQICYLKQFF